MQDSLYSECSSPAESYAPESPLSTTDAGEGTSAQDIGSEYDYAWIATRDEPSLRMPELVPGFWAIPDFFP